MADYLVLNEFVPGTKAKAQEVNANFTALKEAIGEKALINGDATQNFNVADAILAQHAITKAQLDSITAVTNKKIDGITNRFCLKSGNITAGEADLLAFSGTTLSFKIGSGYPSVVWNSANGTQETITALANITGLSTNGTYSVMKDLNATNAFAIASKVTQGKTFPISPSDGDYHCLTASAMTTYKRVSGSWVETQYIQLGTVTVSGSVITSVTTKSYNQNGQDLTIQNFMQNLVANGYTKLPNGLILQWGSGTVAQNSSATITFPIVFPNACLVSPVVTEVGSANAYSSKKVSSKTVSNFVIYNWSPEVNFSYITVGY